MVWGWLKCIIFIVHFISVIIIPAALQIIRHQIPEVGDPPTGYLIHPSHCLTCDCLAVHSIPWHQGLPSLGAPSLWLTLSPGCLSSLLFDSRTNCLYCSFPVFVCWGCLTRSCKWTKNQGLCSLWNLQGRILPCVFWLLVVVGSSWCPWACICSPPLSSFSGMWPSSPCMSVSLLFLRECLSC